MACGYNNAKIYQISYRYHCRFRFMEQYCIVFTAVDRQKYNNDVTIRYLRHCYIPRKIR